MAKQVKLSVSARSRIGGTVANKLKKEGLIPAVIYGGKEDSLSLQIGARDITNVLSRARGENILVELDIDNAGAKTTRMALIQEVQHAPLYGKIVHVDFHAVKDLPLDTLVEIVKSLIESSTQSPESAA